jgi:DNA invertase Pin-like site-specific DNA recombinase
VEKMTEILESVKRTPKRYGYARVSTLGQDLEAQIQQLEQERCDVIYSEKYTGTKMDRPEFSKLLEVLEEGDTLILTKLDRFARSANDGMRVVKELFKRGIRVHILSMGIIEDTPTGRLIFNIMSSFAEFERDMIVERTSEGKAIAKMNPDFKEGRPKKFTKKQIEHALQLMETNSYNQVVELTGISRSTLKRAMRESKSATIVTE